MSGLGTVSVNAGPLFKSTNGLVIMSGAVYINDFTPEIARQWIRVLEEIAGQEAQKSPESSGISIE